MPGLCCSPKRIGIISALRKEGLSNKLIAEKVGKDRRTVDRLVKKLGQDGIVLHAPKSGRPPCTTKRDDRILKKRVLEDRRRGSTELQAIMLKAGVEISKRTIRRRLLNMGLVARRLR